MALKSDITINTASFQESAVSEEARVANQSIQENAAKYPSFHEISSVAQYRRLMKSEDFFPKPNPALDSGVSFSIPSSENGRSIPCRSFKPPEGSKPKAILMHIHGGGFALNDETLMDVYLHRLSQTCSIACVSVGYRLAPEHVYPAAAEDCYDAAEWLIDNGHAHFDAELGFIGGESAGGCLTLLTALHLLKSSNNKYQDYDLKGLLVNYPATDLTSTPSVHNLKHDRPLNLDGKSYQAYISTYLADMSLHDRKSPNISPLYADLKGLKLPPALFLCGTEDILLDDSLFMSVKWMVAGGEAIMKAIPGAPHAFIENPNLDMFENSRKGMEYVETFVKAKTR